MPTAPSNLLLIDDDPVFCEVLAAALTRRAYPTTVVHDAAQAAQCAQQQEFAYAVLDLRMPNASGLTVIPLLLQYCPGIRIVVLTGYASIATAVEAIKLGAVHYLTKPVEVDAIVTALHAAPDAALPIADERPSPERLEWEYLQKVLLENDGNITATARSLRMHRRTLQRKLGKRPVRT